MYYLLAFPDKMTKQLVPYEFGSVAWPIYIYVKLKIYEIEIQYHERHHYE